MARDTRFLKRFGLRIRELRNEQGWTLEETEDHGWTDCVHMQKIESGIKDISLTTVRRLSKLFKISISELFEDL